MNPFNDGDELRVPTGLSADQVTRITKNGSIYVSKRYRTHRRISADLVVTSVVILVFIALVIILQGAK